MNEKIKYTKEYYNRDVNIKRYGEAINNVGLWNSEKIIFKKYINKKDKILDLGCGAGRTTINLYKNGYKDIVGLDISDNLINYAKNYSIENNLNINFVVGDATKLNYQDNSFDVVIFSFNGMQCIPGKKNRDNVLKEVYRVLKPGGYYIFTAHNRDDSGKFQHVWNEEKIKWENGKQDKNLEMFGDRYSIDQTGEIAFVHFSNIEEMKEFIYQEDFIIIEFIKSTDIAIENENTKKFCNPTVFWIVRKK